VATYNGIHDIPLVAGHPALDLVNTVEPRLPAPAQRPTLDRLVTPSDLLVWAARAGLLNETEVAAETKVWASEPHLAGRCLTGVLAGREALYAVLTSRLADHPSDTDPGDDADADADGDVDAGATGGRASGGVIDSQLALISASWAAATARTRLRPVPGGDRGFEPVVGTEPGLLVLDRVAVATVELLTSVDLGLLRACPLEEGGCGWLFLDRSRGHTRRWCVMADCGTKAKARRLNDRRRIARSHV
jgi:predicted RNA-binding Zn ribbon-like protein